MTPLAGIVTRARVNATASSKVRLEMRLLRDTSGISPIGVTPIVRSTTPMLVSPRRPLSLMNATTAPKPSDKISAAGSSTFLFGDAACSGTAARDSTRAFAAW